MKSSLFTTVLSLFALAAITPGSDPKALSVGSAAPAISVHTWIKGKPVKAFEKGTIYVVDFFATWCPPCNNSMPHLSKLASKFRDKVTVIGVDVRENDEGDKVQPGKAMDEKVAKFVAGKGDAMAYNVCTDDLKGSMMAKWMAASGEHGIPCAFIIDKKGDIADIILGYGGNADHRLDDALDQLLSGTFDYKAATVSHEKEVSKG